MIFKSKYSANEDGKNWTVERFDSLGKEMISMKRYRKLTFRRPVETDGETLVTKATLITELEGGIDAILEF